MLNELRFFDDIVLVSQNKQELAGMMQTFSKNVRYQDWKQTWKKRKS